MPDKPIPEDDPVVSKSLAPHYLLAMLVLVATLFWALWDEDFGQRPFRGREVRAPGHAAGAKRLD